MLNRINTPRAKMYPLGLKSHLALQCWNCSFLKPTIGGKLSFTFYSWNMHIFTYIYTLRVYTYIHEQRREQNTSISVRFLLLWTDTMTTATLIRTTLIGAGLQVQRFSPLSSRQEHGSIQAGMAQEELRVLHLNLKAARRTLTSRQLGWGS